MNEIRAGFREAVETGYEHRARPCSSCPTFGICCRDAHFVNVRVTRLEAAAISSVLDELSEMERAKVYSRIDETVSRYELDVPGESFAKTYACPLFEAGVGCLVHEAAKPLPCIAHACYENETDLPPDEMLESAERKIFELNRRVYRRMEAAEPLPVAVQRSRK